MIPAGPAPAAAPPPMPPPSAPTAARTSGLAIVSLVCGILGGCFGPLASIPAIITGHIARGRLKRDPSEKGSGMALAGLILGYTGLALAIIVSIGLVALAVPTLGEARERAIQVQTANNLRLVGVALHSYALEHEGAFPEALADLDPDYLVTPDALTYRTPANPIPQPFVYFPGATVRSQADVIVATTQPDEAGDRVVLFADGKAKILREAEYEAARRR